MKNNGYILVPDMNFQILPLWGQKLGLGHMGIKEIKTIDFMHKTSPNIQLDIHKDMLLSLSIFQGILH